MSSHHKALFHPGTCCQRVQWHVAMSSSSTANVVPLSLLLYPPLAPPALVYLAPALLACPAPALPLCPTLVLPVCPALAFASALWWDCRISIHEC